MRLPGSGGHVAVSHRKVSLNLIRRQSEQNRRERRRSRWREHPTWRGSARGQRINTKAVVAAAGGCRVMGAREQSVEERRDPSERGLFFAEWRTPEGFGSPEQTAVMTAPAGTLTISHGERSGTIGSGRRDTVPETAEVAGGGERRLDSGHLLKEEPGRLQ